MYNKVSDRGDVVIRKPGFSIVDTHEPVIAISLSRVYSHHTLACSHRNEIYPVGRRQGVGQFVSPGLLSHI